MAYQLKSTGIATQCLMCIAVDPDTGTIKDYASAAVTTDLVVGANVTLGTQAWDGISRDYFRLGAGTAADDFVAFGATKPVWNLTDSGTQLTAVAIGEVAGASARCFGADSNNYFAAIDLGASAYYPTLRVGATAKRGAGAALTTGTKAIFGVAIDRTNSCTAFRSLDTDATMTVDAGIGGAVSGSSNFALNYVGRRDDSTTHQQDKWHLIAFFSGLLVEADFDALRDDWFGTLFESSGGDVTAPVLTSPTGTATGATTADVGATTDEGNGTLYAVATTSATQPNAAQIKAGQDHTGAAAPWGGSQAVASVGAKTLGATGLTASTGYYAHLIHTDTATNDSNIVTSAQFTTDALTLWGFDLDTLPGAVFGAISGALTGLTRETAVSIAVRVYDASTGALVHEAAPAVTDANGRLARYEHAALASDTYDVVFKRVSDGAIACARLTTT